MRGPRAIPWSKLIAERQGRKANDLNIDNIARLSAAVVLAAVVCLAAAVRYPAVADQERDQFGIWRP